MRAAAALLAAVLAAAGCKAAGGDLTARASDEWTHTYPLADKGEVQIVNTNGQITIEGISGSMLEIRAERIARGATEALARELLPRIKIKEDVGPGRVSIETERIAGLMIGASFVVDYHVRAPASAVVRARTVNGQLEVEALTGRAVLNTVNGSVTARALSGGIEVRTVNGRVQVTLRAVGNDPVELRTTNGGIDLAIPPSAKAYVSASTVNGPIETSGLTLDLMGEQSKRRMRGRMNGGGTPIDVTTVNGRIRIASAEELAAEKAEGNRQK